MSRPLQDLWTKKSEDKSPRRSRPRNNKLEPISLEELDGDRQFREGGPGVLSNIRTPPPPTPHLEESVREYVRDHHLEGTVNLNALPAIFRDLLPSVGNYLVSPGDSELLPIGDNVYSSPGDSVYRDIVSLTTYETLSPGDEYRFRGDIESVAPGDNVYMSSGATELSSSPGVRGVSPGVHERGRVLDESVASSNGKRSPSLSPGDVLLSTPGDTYDEVTHNEGVGLPLDGDIEPLSPQFINREQHLQIRALTRAEDGHSANEQRAYQALWNSANPVMGQKFRRNTIGHAGLSKMLKVDKRQTKRWIPELIAKLSLDIEIESNYARKTTYKIYDRDEIHARRLRAGYTSYLRNRGGVELLKRGGLEAHKSSMSPGDDNAIRQHSQFSRGGDKEALIRGDTKPSPTLSPGDTVPPGGGDTVPPLYKEVNSKHVFEADSSSASELPSLIESLHNFGIDADDAFALKLLANSRNACPDVSLAEIAHFCKSKAQYRGIQKSVTGFLLTAVPLCLQGRSFELYRQAEQARIEDERKEILRLKAEAERTLSSREGREEWELESAEQTLTWLRTHHSDIFTTQGESNS